jgi:hypothetical protein
MPLTVLKGALLKVGNALAAACCCDYWCNLVPDECGNEFYNCGKKGSGTVGLCTDECGPPPPTEKCECGPMKQCAECEECIDRKCEKIWDCCRDATGCGACSECKDNVCVPCQQCSTCVDGVCIPCPYGCTNGECNPPPPPPPPAQCYCCYDEDPSVGGSNEMIGTHCQSTPCASGLYKSGPYPCSQCAEDCQRYSCVPNGCGKRKCKPSAEGTYTTKAECEGACKDDDCNAPCLFGTAEGPGYFQIDSCERDICVSYSSLNSKPIRVQIYGQTLDQNCNEVAFTIKSDSGWRCEQCCDCPSFGQRATDPRDCQGGPSGKISWTKPQGSTRFGVQVLTACGADPSIQIRACSDCEDRPEPANCGCQEDGDCPDITRTGCICCRGKCVKGPGPCPGCTDEECFQTFGEWYLDFFAPTDNFGEEMHPECNGYESLGPFDTPEEAGSRASPHPECGATTEGAWWGACCARTGECYHTREEVCPP